MENTVVEDGCCEAEAAIDLQNNLQISCSTVIELRNKKPILGVWIIPSMPTDNFVHRVLLEEGVQCLNSWENEKQFPDVFRLLFHTPPIRDIDLDLIRTAKNRITFRRVNRISSGDDFMHEVDAALATVSEIHESGDELHIYSESLFEVPSNIELRKRPCREQLGVRMLWEDTICELLFVINERQSSKISRNLNYLLKKIRFTPRDAFESFLVNSITHESEPLAAEQSWITTKSITWLPHQHLLGSKDLMDLYGINNTKSGSIYNCTDKHKILDLTEKLLLGKTTRSSKQAIYDLCEEILANAVILRGKNSKKLTAPSKLGINFKQRLEFKTIFHPSFIRREGFPHILRNRIEDFLSGRHGVTEFSEGWQERVSAPDALESDTRVFFAIAFLNFIYPELRRVPPYYSLDEEEFEAEKVADDYQECMKWWNMYLSDVPFPRDKLYLSMGEFIKSVFRYRGRREMSGLWQRIRVDSFRYRYRTEVVKNFEPYQKNPIKNLECEKFDVNRNDALFNIFRSNTVDQTWFGRKKNADYIDGPFYICGVFAEPVENRLVEYVAAITLKAMPSPETDFVFGVGKRGTFCATIVSLLQNIPFSSLTLRPKFDISPRAFRKKKIRTAFVLDDCIKTGYTNYHILNWLRSDSEPSCRSIRNLVWFNFCRVDPFIRDGDPPKEVRKYLVKLDALREYTDFDSSHKFKPKGVPPFFSINQNGQPDINDEWENLIPTKAAIENVFNSYSALYDSAFDVLNKSNSLQLESLQHEIKHITATGLFRNFKVVPREFKSLSRILCRLQWLLADDTVLPGKFLKEQLGKMRDRFWRLFWENGAKYKPELLNRHPKLLLLLGVYFHKKLQKELISGEKPNILVANDRLSIPLAVSISLACRYDKDAEIKYQIALASNDGTRISGFQTLLSQKKRIIVATVTNSTTLNNFAGKLKNIFEEKSKEYGIDIKQIATCSLFDVGYLNEDPVRDTDLYGQFFSLITVPAAEPLNLPQLLKNFESYFVGVSNAEDLIKLALFCLSHHEGLKYNRVSIVCWKPGYSYELIQGIGPINAADAPKCWQNVPSLAVLTSKIIANMDDVKNSFWIKQGNAKILFKCKEESYLASFNDVPEEDGIRVKRINRNKVKEWNRCSVADERYWNNIGKPDRFLVCTFECNKTEWIIVVDNICVKDVPLLTADEFRVKRFAGLLKQHLKRCAGPDIE